MLTSRSVVVTWKPSSSSYITGYLISYITNASYTNGRSVIVDGGSTASYTLINLEEDTFYNIAIQATTKNNVSANSDEVLVRTYTDGK